MQKDTSKLVFHSSGLDISDIVVHDHLSDIKIKEKSLSLTLDLLTERAVVELPFKLQKGSTASLQIKFRGPLTGSLAGYYLSSWKNEGIEEYYSLTQLAV